MSDIVDGNSSSDGQPMYNTHAENVMDSIAPGAFGVTETTTDVKAGMGNIETVTLTSADDGTSIFAEHHQLGVLNTSPPAQDFAGARDAGTK
jgi:hypothetical protein